MNVGTAVLTLEALRAADLCYLEKKNIRGGGGIRPLPAVRGLNTIGQQVYPRRNICFGTFT